jgi:2-oxoglutarate ferredoxin oxidoreductase subunit alpha
MNDHVSQPFNWDDTKAYKRGKVLNAEELDKLQKYGRYLDVDDDGITYRTIPATHPTKGAFVTRGTSRDEYAVYTEEGGAYKRNMDRLMKKWHTAKDIVPGPQLYQDKNKSKNGIIFFGTSTYSSEEAIDLLKGNKIELDALRLKSFPFNKAVEDFINSHDKVFVVEQNRDAQMRSLMMIELGADPNKIIPVLNYDGMPITADNILKQVTKVLSPAPKLKKVV